MINKLWHRILCRFNKHYPLKHTWGANRYGVWDKIVCVHCGTVTWHSYQKKTYTPIYSPELEGVASQVMAEKLDADIINDPLAEQHETWLKEQEDKP